MLSTLLLSLCFLADPPAPPPLEEAVDAKSTKIVLLAGKPGPKQKPGEHENFASSVVLYKLLKQTADVAPVLVKEWPTDEKLFDGAKCVVLYTEGGGSQEYLTDARMAVLQKLVDKGVGLVHMHTAIDYPEKYGDQVKGWAGGYWHKGISCRGHWDVTFKDLPEHPITRGVKSFTINDGWLFHDDFVEGMKGVTVLGASIAPEKLVNTPSAKKDLNKPEALGWAYERPNGKGRAYTFTGGHDQKNWGQEGLRKMVANGILWAAGLEIPKDGAPVAYKDEEIMWHVEPRSKK